MYAIVLEKKPKTIHLKNIESEKTSYLNAPDAKVKKGDVLNVSIQSTSFSKGNTFFKGEYEILNDGKTEFENCLKCGEAQDKKDNPLCYDCWKGLINHGKIAKKTRKNLSDMDLKDVIDINKNIQFIANNFDLRESFVDFSFGKVKEGLNGVDLNMEDKEKRKHYQLILENMADDYQQLPEVKGLFFEIAFHKVIDSMKSDEFGIRNIEPNYLNSWLNTENIDYEADGEIQFKLGKKGFDKPVYALYDCKAYKSGYNIKSHLEKMLKYLRHKKDDLRISKNYKYFIIVSGKFTGKPEFHSMKFSDADRDELRLILITSYQIERIHKVSWNKYLNSQMFFEQFRWEDILEPTNANPIELVTDKKVNELIEKAKKNARTS